MWERRVKGLPDRLVLPCWLVGLKSSLGNNGETGQLPGAWRIWLPLGTRGVPDRASEPGMGSELFVVTVEADLVPVQLAASSESRAGVLLSMSLALVERYVASCPSYSGFSSPSLAKGRLLRSGHVPFWPRHLPPCPDLGVSLASGVIDPVFCCHLSCPAKEFWGPPCTMLSPEAYGLD